jgi:hypothetical protein
MARRGFFAEMNRRIKAAEREMERRKRLEVRERTAEARRREQHKRELARLTSQLSKAEAAERKRLEKEQREAYCASREDEAELRTEELADACAEIDALLSATLGHDDFVDLSTLKATVVHPPFDRPDLAVPYGAPTPAERPSEPVLVLPEPPTGLAKLWGTRRYEDAVRTANASHRRAVLEWEQECAAAEQRDREALERHAAIEQQRVEALEREQARYARECNEREKETASHNERLQELIVNLGYGTPAAVQEYVAIVLSNSIYPEHFPVEHMFSFDPTTAELTLKVGILEPSLLPSTKRYKYVKASDEIVPVPMPQKECKERYARAVHQVALRSIHEVFEADRRGLIRTIALEVVTSAIDERTGRRGEVPLAFVGAARETFMEFDLSGVVPEKTLAHMGASLSKNPFGLIPAERTGVRRS